MARFLPIFVLLAIAVWVFSIVDCALQEPTRHRGVSKPVWLMIVIVIPVIGGILWFAIGRSRRRNSQPAFKAPDDNPEFLGRIGSIADQDERIRRLEEELAALDSDAPDPRVASSSDAPAEEAALDAEDDADDDANGAGPDGSPRGNLS